MRHVSEKLSKARLEEKQGENIPAKARPCFHLTACKGWMNDPNGFIYYRGAYHLFYQYYPYTSRWGLMHWGHAVSRDLLSWKYLPAALAPDQAYDRYGCFSGSSIELADGRLLLMYTGVRREKGENGERETVQTQCLAIGNGTDFDKLPQNPAIDDKNMPEGASREDFRDPKMIPWKDGTFRCVMANRAEDGSGQVLLYKSPDGFRWEFEKILIKNNQHLGTMWECPDLFCLDGRWILIISPMDMLPVKGKYSAGNISMCLIGKKGGDPGQLTVTDDQPLDYGIDFYAAQTVLTPDGRRVMIGWMQNWDTITIREPDAPWAGQMTLPRELFLREGRLCQRPVRELEQLRRGKTEYCDIPVSDRKTLPGVSGRVADLEIRVRANERERSYEKFEIHFAEKGQCHTCLSYRPAESLLTLDRRFSGTRRALMHECSCFIENAQQELQIRVILDRYSVEVFAEDGAKVMTAAIYTEPDADGISFCATGEAEMDITLYSLES